MVQAVNQRGRSPRSPSGHPHVRRPRSRSRDSGDENEPIQERFFRPHFLQAPGDLTVQEGKLCRMDCKVSGLPTPDLSWQLDGKPIRPDSAHKMLVRENGVHSLIIEPVTSRDAGIYTCIATNRAGQNSFSLELVVAAALLCPLGCCFVCSSSADCWAENWIPFPAKLETTMNFKRHESSPVKWSDWNCYRLDGKKLFWGS